MATLYRLVTLFIHYSFYIKKKVYKHNFLVPVGCRLSARVGQNRRRGENITTYILIEMNCRNVEQRLHSSSNLSHKNIQDPGWRVWLSHSWVNHLRITWICSLHSPNSSNRGTHWHFYFYFWIRTDTKIINNLHWAVKRTLFLSPAMYCQQHQIHPSRGLCDPR